MAASRRVAVLLTAVILVSTLYSVYLGVLSPVKRGLGGWTLLGEDEERLESVLASASVRLRVYRVNVDGDSLARAIDSIIDYCVKQDVQGGWDVCDVDPGELERYAGEGRLAVIAVVARISNTGLAPVSVGGPGPLCGQSYNLEHLEDSSLVPLVVHREPVAYLEFKVLEGEVVLGYGGYCQLALVMRKLLPGSFSETVYGFIVVTPFKGVFSIESSVEIDRVWHDITLNVSVEIR